ncbi:MAG: FHA domain-containing protein [Myxococcales bacterium]|nr:FHA domain-containing protein [Myxococcota bacterium]MDW8283005.1 FHA domain-containing protein [Myxococcales bacterium]
MWRVTATDREGREVARVEIEAGDLTIGRDADRQLILSSPSVSRRHCRLRIDGSGPVIMDEGSANGVIVNGVRITAPTAVNQLSRIEVAEFRLQVEPVGGPHPVGPAGVMHPPGGIAMPMAAAGPVPDVVRLIAEGGPYDGRIFELPPLQEIAVGRAMDNDLILDDPSLSRKHAKLRRLGGGRLEVEDTRSANGTYVNGRKVDRAQLGPGDTLRFGELVFRIDGGGLAPAARPRGQAAAASVPPMVRVAFFGLAGVALLVWVVWIVKLLTPTPQPQKGQVEEAIARFIAQADGALRSAQEEFGRRNWARAKEEAERALGFDPANLEAARLRAQASRAEADEVRFKRGVIDLEKGSPESLQAALATFHAMSPDSTYRLEFAQRLTTRLHQAGLDMCRRKLFRECATLLCDAYRVAPPNQKPGGQFARTLRDAERRGRIMAQCVLK